MTQAEKLKESMKAFPVTCPHSRLGWCLACVRALWNRWMIAESEASKYWQIIEIVDPEGKIK